MNAFYKCAALDALSREHIPAICPTAIFQFTTRSSRRISRCQALILAPPETPLEPETPSDVR